MITLEKAAEGNDPYGWYDQHGNRYLFLSHRDAALFLRRKMMEFFFSSR